MTESLKRRVAALEKRLTTSETILRVELPDGTQKDVRALEWWKNRNEWRFVDAVKVDPHGWPPFVLETAKLFDDGVQAAKANGGAIKGVNGETLTLEYLRQERDDLLIKFFGEAVD